MKYTNIFGDTEVAGYSPDGLGDYYKITDAQNDHNYWQEKIVSALQGLSLAHTTDCQIIYGGAVTDGGSGTVDVSAGLAMGKDASGNIRLVTIPALTGVSLPSGWNDDRQIWIIGKYEHSLETSTRNHKLATTSYHYILEDNYLGNADSDDLFVDSDPNSVADTVICWGSFKMNGTTFASDTGRTDNMGLDIAGNFQMGTGTKIDFYNEVGDKLDFHNDLYKIGVSASALFYEVETSAKHSFTVNDVEKVTVNQYGLGVGTVATSTYTFNVNGHGHISGDFMARDTEINEYGIGVNGATATASIALRVSGKAFVEYAGAPFGVDRLITDGTLVEFYQDSNLEGNISVSGSTVSYNPFTGSHYGWSKQPDSELEKGHLMIMTGDNKYVGDNPDREIIYGINKCNKINDKSVIGSYLSRLEPTHESDDPENPILIMAVGNGVMWIADKGEDLEPGDFIISSDIEGHGMKASDDFPVSYIIAKVAEKVSWKDVIDLIDGVKHKKISVLYESFKYKN